jgi:hypothetical protein
MHVSLPQRTTKIKHTHSYFARTVRPVEEQKISNVHNGRAIAQAVSRLPLTAEARIRARVSPCGLAHVYLPYQYHSTVALLLTYQLGDDRSAGGRSSETSSHPIDINNIHTERQQTFMFHKRRGISLPVE